MILADAVGEPALLELQYAPRSVDARLIDALADEARSGGDELDDIARGLKVEVRTETLPHGVYGLRVKLPKPRPSDGLVGWVLVTVLKPALRRLVVGHELAHWIARSSGLAHTHTDVWLIALALLMPTDAVRAMRDAPVAEVAAAFGVPWWAADVRLKILSRDDGLAAA